METPQCQCGLECAKRVSRKEASFGREFYTCPQPQGVQCRFFKWADEENEPPKKTKKAANEDAQEPPRKLRRTDGDVDVSMMVREVNQTKEMLKTLMEVTLSLSKIAERLEKAVSKTEGSP